MFQWIPFVMVRVVVGFAGGIILGIHAPSVTLGNLACLIFALLICSYVALWLIPQATYWRGTASGCVGLASIAVAGYLTTGAKTDSLKPSDISHLTKAIEFYTAEVTTVDKKPNSIQVVLRVQDVRTSGRWEPASGNILIYLPLTTTLLSCGERVMVSGPPSPIPPPSNPGEFDFQAYSRTRNISFQHSVNEGRIKIIQRKKIVGTFSYPGIAREWATAVLSKYVPGPRENGIARALVLGVTDGIDNELQSAYGASGAMHVLSVSGLHVAVLYAIVLALLRPLRFFVWGSWAILILSLGCLWMYAFITGLSPSVLRAVVMFSFILAAKPAGRNSVIYNTLAASAFLLLLCDPWLILSVGFQLSYLAVLGIVWLQGPLNSVVKPRGVVWTKLWQVSVVSVAAQAATFAPSLYYFHQFPVYFLISNLVVIPVSTGVLVAGIVLLVVSPVEIIARAVGWCVQFFVGVLNGSVFLIQKLPGSVVDGVYISAGQCWLLLAMTVAVVLLVRYRRLNLAIVLLVLSFFYGSLQWAHLASRVITDQLVVFDIRGHSAFGRIHNGQAILCADSSFLADKVNVRRHVWPLLIEAGVNNVKNVQAETHLRMHGQRQFCWNGKWIVYVGGPLSNAANGITIDYLLAGNDAISSLDLLTGKIHFKQLILTSSDSRPVVDRLLREAAERRIPVVAVQKGGARTFNLDI